MNKFRQFAYWWYKNVLCSIDEKVKPVYAISVLILMFTLLFLGAVSMVFWYIMIGIFIPPMLISFYSTLFAEKGKFEDRVEFDKRSDKINSILND